MPPRVPQDHSFYNGFLDEVTLAGYAQETGIARPSIFVDGPVVMLGNYAGNCVTYTADRYSLIIGKKFADADLLRPLGKDCATKTYFPEWTLKDMSGKIDPYEIGKRFARFCIDAINEENRKGEVTHGAHE